MRKSSGLSMEEKNKEKPPPLDHPVPRACMERRSSGEKIKPFLLKLALPLSLPFAALIFSIISRTRRKRSFCSDSSSSKASPMDSDDSLSIIDLEEEEEEEEEATSSEIMDEPYLEIMRAERPEVPAAEVATANFQEELKLVERIEGLNLRSQESTSLPEYVEEEIQGLKSHLSEIESQFQEFCGAKEQESVFQKLQIMCLGFKLECLESRNQRLEDAIFDRSGAPRARTELRTLKRKVEKLSRLDRAHLLRDRRRNLALNSQEVELLRLDVVLKQLKDLAAQLDDKFDSLAAKVDSSSKRTEEMVGEHNARMLSNEELFDQLELFRSQWYQEMEELVYLCWVGASLSHELLSLHQEQEPEEEPEPAQAESHDTDTECSSSPPAAELGGGGDDGGAISSDAEARRKRNSRLLHKLKGWAKGKGKERGRRHAHAQGKVESSKLRTKDLD